MPKVMLAKKIHKKSTHLDHSYLKHALINNVTSENSDNARWLLKDDIKS